MDPTIVYYGQIKCQNDKCQHRAYYEYEGKYFCGIHCKVADRLTLPKDPLKDVKSGLLLKERQQLVDKMAKENQEQEKKGNVIVTKLGMMKTCPHVDGYLKVFPNYMHQNRKDGFGCQSLSPKHIGPIKHGQLDLPEALNLENFFQGSKCYPSEVDKDGNPSQLFYETQIAMFKDPIPHRHKDSAQTTSSKNKNIPVYFVWKTQDKKIHKLDYVTSRQFYCYFYEKMVKDLPDFKKLKELIQQGYNLQICGYDGYEVTKTVEEHYLDSSRPFGHELVLYTLLTHDKSTILGGNTNNF